MADLFLTIDKLLNNGYGLARDSEGQVVFIPDALPGERYRVSALKRYKGTLQAESYERQQSAAQRVDPSCPHNDTCGGCSLLHINHEHELMFKQAYFADVLQRIGKVSDPDIKGYDFPWRGSRVRGKFHTDQQGRLGFRQQKGHQVSALTHCAVLPERVQALLAELQSGIGGFRGEVWFACDASATRVGLEFHAAHRGKRTIRWQFPSVQGYIYKDRDGRVLKRWGQPEIEHQWHDVRVQLEPSQFCQANPASWPTFFAIVTEYLEHFQPAVLWDVHAGAGFLSSCLKGRAVIATEPEVRAWNQMARALPEAGIQAECVHATAEKLLKDRPGRLKAVTGLLLDPPRAGLSGQLRQWIVEQGPESLLYFSCDIGSFARDIAFLSQAYQPAGPFHAMNVSPGTLKLEVAVMMVRIPNTQQI